MSLKKKKAAWRQWTTDRLLDLRMCDLQLRLEGTVLEERIADLETELERLGLRFRPHFWLSDEWFSPSGVPGIAIPFYLADNRLLRLERQQMLEVEGGNRKWCMQILRHETGHAIDHAYGLHRRRRWQHLFGHSSRPYPSLYRPRPFSKRYVHHLDSWYAQSHPDEDFAETFAVWMASGSTWRRRYHGWPALKKLQYVDELMQEIATSKPVVTTRRQVDPLSSLRKTLRQHYESRRARYGLDDPDLYDLDLEKLFSSERRHAHKEAASVFLRSVEHETLQAVCRWTGQSTYTVKQIYSQMIHRCRKLRLRLRGSRKQTRQEIFVLLTVHTMNALQKGRLRLSL